MRAMPQEMALDGRSVTGFKLKLTGKDRLTEPLPSECRRRQSYASLPSVGGKPTPQISGLVLDYVDGFYGKAYQWYWHYQ
jgi:hypothetical protein